MTTVVAIQGDGFTVLGTDSRISSIDSDGFVSRMHTVSSNMSKIAQVSGMLIGVAGDVRAINLISYSLAVPPAPHSLKGKKLDEYVTNKFIPALRHCFEANGYSPPPKESAEHTAEHGSEILLSVNATVYQIDNDYSWSNDASGLYAIGTGGQYAVGALAALIKGKIDTHISAKKHCLNSLAIAAKFDPHTGHPYQTYHQEAVPGRKPANPGTETKTISKSRTGKATK